MRRSALAFMALLVVGAITAGSRPLWPDLGKNSYLVSTAPTQPQAWLPIGDEDGDDLGFTAGRVEVRRTTPRWFRGLPAQPPRPADRGGDLVLRLSPGPLEGQSPETSEITILLTLRSKTGVTREVEHRWCNLVPFLFAFEIDGEPYCVPDSLAGHDGGGIKSVPLVEPGQERTWMLTMSAASLLEALCCSRQFTGEVAMRACFASTQHYSLCTLEWRSEGNPEPKAPRLAMSNRVTYTFEAGVCRLARVSLE